MNITRLSPPSILRKQPWNKANTCVVCIDTRGVIHVPTHIVHDEVWVVTWGNSHGGVALLG